MAVLSACSSFVTERGCGLSFAPLPEPGWREQHRFHCRCHFRPSSAWLEPGENLAIRPIRDLLFLRLPFQMKPPGHVQVGPPARVHSARPPPVLLLVRGAPRPIPPVAPDRFFFASSPPHTTP